jgi:uncharacterized membrane protein
MDVLLVGALWLHTLAFVIAWGYYGVLGRVILPGLGRSLPPAARASAVVAIERRALPLVAISLVLFVGTGTYLLVSDPAYAGLGNVFASTWTTMMLAKHVLVVAMVGLGIGVDVVVRRVAADSTDESRARSFRQLSLCAETTTALGALVVLLTAVAQVG